MVRARARRGRQVGKLDSSTIPDQGKNVGRGLLERAVRGKTVIDVELEAVGHDVSPAPTVSGSRDGRDAAVGQPIDDALDGLGAQAGNNFHISAKNQAEADRAFAALSAGGTATMQIANAPPWGPYFGMCVDRFGVQ